MITLSVTGNLEFLQVQAKDLGVAKVRELTELLYIGLLVNSPKDSGKFMSNWNVSTNTANPTSTKATTPDLSKVDRLKLESGDSAVINNPLPYYPVIEFGLYPGTGPKTVNGFSSQAPDGVTRPTLRELAAYL